MTWRREEAESGRTGGFRGLEQGAAEMNDR
jgi:hypothetical protein